MNDVINIARLRFELLRKEALKDEKVREFLKKQEEDNESDRSIKDSKE